MKRKKSTEDTEQDLPFRLTVEIPRPLNQALEACCGALEMDKREGVVQGIKMFINSHRDEMAADLHRKIEEFEECRKTLNVG